MRIIIAGAGEVGSHLAKMLSNENQDIILLDSDQACLDAINSSYNLMTWNGSPASFQTLRAVNVADTDLFIAVTPYETMNITSCAIAKRLGAKMTVARIDNNEFLQPNNGSVLTSIGVDNLIYPENLASEEINVALQHNWSRYWGNLHNGKLLLIGVKIRTECPVLNCKLRDLPVTAHDFHVCAIKRDDETIIPSGNDSIQLNDIVFFITTPNHVTDVRNLCGKIKRNIKKVMIMGGSPIAMRFALDYHDDYHIKIIDLDREHCEMMATRLPECEIVHGDGRDVDILVENNISQYDAFLALTDSSETNILTCLTAKEFNVPRTIADVEKLQFLSQAENLNIGKAINKKLLASSHIFQILLDTDENSAKCLTLANAEVAELMVKEGAKITRAKIMDLKLPREMTIAAMVHDGHCKMVGGQTQMSAGDHVVVFCLSGFLHKIEKWFT